MQNILKKINKKREFFVVIGAILALFIAFIAQKFMNIKPCKLCVYERYLYLNAAVCALLVIKFFKNQIIKYILFFSLLSISTLSLYHVLYEKDYIKTSAICDSDNDLANLTRDEIKQLILKAEMPSCKTPVYVFRTISFAELNFYYSLVLLGVYMIKRNEKY